MSLSKNMMATTTRDDTRDREDTLQEKMTESKYE